jgi:hypothetical protein
MIHIDDVPAMIVAFRERWAERDVRMDVMDSVVRGDWQVGGPDTDDVENRSPNLIQVALEDTAEAASLIPSTRVAPSGPSDEDHERADAMERIAVGYMDTSQIELLTIRSLLDLAGFGLFCWVVTMNEESGSPMIQWRDPKTFYPETGHVTFDAVRKGVFLREMYATQLPDEWQAKIDDWASTTGEHPKYWNDKKLVLAEIYTEDEILIAALYRQGVGPGSHATYRPIELDRRKTVGGICPVVMGQRLALDNEPRGQFDQIVKVMQAHIRLMSMVLDYADQAVYSDVWVKDLIGTMPMGGGSYINLGPQGAIGRVAPAVTSMSVFQEMDQLVSSIHLGGRWPKTRPGEIDQAIASAKFVEATAGMMNTVIRTYHLILKRAFEQALRVCFKVDAEEGRDRTVGGVLRNQQFQFERTADDIDLGAKVRVEYGLGLGRDPAQSMVLGIQAKQAGFVSGEFVQENFEGITDVALERQRIDTEALRDMAFARIMQGLESGEVPMSALPKIAKARRNGADIFELFEEFVSSPAEEAQDQMMTSGLDGSQVAPGAPPSASPGAAPIPPGVEELLGGGGPPGPGGPPPGPGGGEPPQARSRLNSPLGDGSFASSQVG